MRTPRIFADGPAGAEKIFRRLVEDLANDLRMEPGPEVVWASTTTLRLAIDSGAELREREIVLPLSLERRPASESDAKAARRLAMGLFRARDHLLGSALGALVADAAQAKAAASGADTESVLYVGRAARVSVAHSAQTAEAAAFGLDTQDVLTAGVETPSDDFSWAAAERRPASLALLLPPDIFVETSVVDAAMRFARELSGLPLPQLAFETDSLLQADEVRLRVRAVRTPPVAIALQRDKAKFDLARLIVSHAAMMLDPAVMTHCLLRAGPGTTDLLPDVLRRTPAPQLARALRPLLEGGFGLPDAPALVGAVTAKTVVARSTGRRVALPGTIAIGKEDNEKDELAARLRAAIVPSALLRRAGGVGRTAAIWYLAKGELDNFKLDDEPREAGLRLAQRALPAARAEGVLLVPNRFGRRIFDALRDYLPTLCVAEVGEWPPQLTQTPRGAVTAGSSP